MQLHCTRPNCPSPVNHFSDLDDPNLPYPLKPKYCKSCRMELILRGRYLPIDVLGKGGFGTAFLARDFDSPTRRRCVVKLFQPPVNLTQSQMETALRLFNQEAVVLERLGLQNPQIPNLYAYFPLMVTNPLTNQSEELFYLVQEFVNGEDLEKRLNREGKLAESAVAEVLREILKVLDFVHRNGAIHRDVKPSNIIQDKRGKLSLLDFGAVKEVTAPNTGARGPTTICSPDYAPPEQIMNGTVDTTSDLYALAASCVVLLTGKESSELRDGISNRWNWRSHAQVSSQLASILEKMLEPKPSDRFSSAREAMLALSGAAGSSLPQSAAKGGPPPSPQPASKPLGRAPATPPASVPSAGSSGAPAAPLSMRRFLSNAAFTGAEGGLLAIAATSLLGTITLGGGVMLAMLAGLGFLQYRRTIEGMDLLIISGLTLAAVVFFPPLHQILGSPDPGTLIVITLMAGGIAVAIAVIFRLIFRILSRIM